jgi:hypothetical protein
MFKLTKSITKATSMMKTKMPGLTCCCAAIALLVLFAAPDGFAYTLPKTGATVNAFVPSSHKIIQEATGDLNKDGIPDAVLVLKDKKEEKENSDADEVPRLLVIIFGVKEGGYTLSAMSEDAILCKTCGGVFGDPFADLKIARGTLVIDHYGGSSDRWGFTHRWRFQDGDWYLIGLASRTENNLRGNYEAKDTNLITGDCIIEKKSASGKVKITRTKVPMKPLSKLSNFKFDY